MIGDTMPEDAYDTGDPIQLRLALLQVIVEAVRDDPDPARRAGRRDDAIRVIAAFRQELTDTHTLLRLLRNDLEEIL